MGLRLVVILLVALILRCWELDRTSLWYDEVITMRVARADNPAALIARLDQLDGTRAPLHPLLLQAWLRVFGWSDLAGRSFSVFCGLVTVWVIFVLGRRAFDDATGRWAAWLAAVCPPLVYYSREARMYAWLVLLTCLSWLVLLSFRHTARRTQCLPYGLLLIALVYSHPVGLFMVAAHGLAYLLVRSCLGTGISVVADDPACRDPGPDPLAGPVSGPRDRLPHATLFRPEPCWRFPSSTLAETASRWPSVWRSSAYGLVCWRSGGSTTTAVRSPT